MPFNPTLPINNSPIVSLELRNQFNGLKALIDAQAAQLAALTAQVTGQSFALVPIGGVVLWHKDMGGTPGLPANFRECDGSPVNDPESPYDGQSLPDYNTSGRFPRAGTASGQTGGIDTFGTATAESFAGGTPLNVVSPDFSPGATPIPPFATFVFVMRVK